MSEFDWVVKWFKERWKGMLICAAVVSLPFFVCFTMLIIRIVSFPSEYNLSKEKITVTAEYASGKKRVTTNGTGKEITGFDTVWVCYLNNEPFYFERTIPVMDTAPIEVELYRGKDGRYHLKKDTDRTVLIEEILLYDFYSCIFAVFIPLPFLGGFLTEWRYQRFKRDLFKNDKGSE
ncbi:MAG: hypothetical protein K5695_02735 [Oscillospiraceae bacterium]|nr:hypothetical protein [Oscillospiraceae bacterium]